MGVFREPGVQRIHLLFSELVQPAPRIFAHAHQVADIRVLYAGGLRGACPYRRRQAQQGQEQDDSRGLHLQAALSFKDYMVEY